MTARFPLLLKFLDANQILSVQVHPKGSGTAGHRPAAKDLVADLQGEISDLAHHIADAFVLGVDAEGGFFFRDADEPGIEADIITDFGEASENDIIGSDLHPDL